MGSTRRRGETLSFKTMANNPAFFEKLPEQFIKDMMKKGRKEKRRE
jgi:hypothetical protein